jgi:hypothetical protein
MDEIPKVVVHPSSARPLALRLAENGLIGKFTGLWPSPKAMHHWLDLNWRKMIQGQMSVAFCGKGFFAFLFEKKEDRDLIFRSGLYFMGARGMYLNKWTPWISAQKMAFHQQSMSGLDSPSFLCIVGMMKP